MRSTAPSVPASSASSITRASAAQVTTGSRDAPLPCSENPENPETLLHHPCCRGGTYHMRMLPEAKRHAERPPEQSHLEGGNQVLGGDDLPVRHVNDGEATGDALALERLQLLAAGDAAQLAHLARQPVWLSVQYSTTALLSSQLVQTCPAMSPASQMRRP